MDYILSPLAVVKGIGAKTFNLYKKLLSIENPRVMDLLFHIPIKVLHRIEYPNLQEVKDNDLITIKVTINVLQSPPKRGLPYRIICSNETGFITIIYFNYYVDFITTNFLEGAKITLSGIVKRSIFNNELTMIHPDYVNKEVPKYEQIYPLTNGLNNRMIRKTIQSILQKLPTIREWIPQNVMNEYNFPSFKESLLKLHNAENDSDLLPNSIYIKRLAFDELLVEQVALKNIRNKIKVSEKTILNRNNELKEHFVELLPFTLTNAQINALNEIENDIYSNRRMLRLLQGDVGSGKTIIACLSMLPYIKNGIQVAFMCPTSILATQHYNFLINLMGGMSINIALLVGDTKAKDRKNILEQLGNGKVNIIVGTHTLFQEKVLFNNLGYVIIDEQHRFGVVQRLKLIEK